MALSGSFSTVSARKSVLAIIAATAAAMLLWVGVPAPARTPDVDASVVVAAELPPEARRTELLIRAGGPFPYAKDGSVFGNREQLLPRQPRGHYREYTVTTPGARDRGARRIVCGGPVPRTPEACFYTADHYASFRRIVQ